MGEKSFGACTNAGTLLKLTAQVTEVSKALLSVSRMVQAGNMVVFAKSGSYVEDETTGERIPLREQGGMYMLKLWIKKPVFSGAGRRSLVKTSSNAVRPSLNVTRQDKTSDNSLSHHGETAIQAESRQEQDKESKTKKRTKTNNSRSNPRQIKVYWHPAQRHAHAGLPLKLLQSHATKL